jgi:glycosyltransferase involved in cell wall biosynthesis
MVARGFDGWRRDFLLQMDALIAYSHRGLMEYQRLGFPAERIYVAVNAVTPRPVTPPPSRPPFFNGRAVVLFVGRLQARKRLDILLRACASLDETLRPEVWIVGDGPARGEIENLAREIYPQVKFLGALYGEALERCFNQADLFVLPGTGGLAVQQAMAHGLPVIVAEGDGTQDDLVLPDAGWQVAAGDVAALSHVLGSALSDPARLRRMGQAAYRVVEKVANIEEMVRIFIQAIEGVLPRGNGGAR